MIKYNKSPYYIYAPPYRFVSAGIKALYLLCHNLNMRGQTCYICTDGSDVDIEEMDDLYYNLNIKFLDFEVAKFHKDNNYNPIVIYTDTVDGNPINASNIVRYMMNFDGSLKKIRRVSDELDFGYSKNISDSMGLEDNRVLFVPTSSPEIFHPPKEGASRQGTCVYLGKYSDYHGGVEKDVTKSSIKVSRDFRKNPSKDQLADILRRSELCYVYENTAIALEAVLCGCPAVFIPNKFLKEDHVHLSRHELGIEGFALNESDKEISRAKNTVTKGRERYLESYQLFQDQLDNFIEITQGHFSLDGKKNINNINIDKDTGSDLLGFKNGVKMMLDKGLFNEMKSNFRKKFPSNKFSYKIKLLNTNSRITIEARIKFKDSNIGRRIRDILTFNS